jgi:hypothetical protein
MACSIAGVYFEVLACLAMVVVFLFAGAGTIPRPLDFLIIGGLTGKIKKNRSRRCFDVSGFYAIFNIKMIYAISEIKCLTLILALANL